MAVSEKSLENLRPWKKGESGNPAGRPRKIVTRIEQEIGVEFRVSFNKQDHYTIIGAMLEMSLRELMEVSKDADAPMFIATLARAIVSDYSNSRTTTVTDLYDRIFGKPRQVSEIVGAGGGALKYEQVRSKLDQFYTGETTGETTGEGADEGANE